MKIEQLLNTFLKLEENQGWWELEGYGQRYWPQIRHFVYARLLQEIGAMAKAQRSWRDRSFSSWMKALPPSYFYPALKRAWWPSVDEADLLVINHPRSVAFEGDWLCPYTDPLLRGSSFKHWVIEDVQQGVHAHPKSAPRTKYLEWPLLLSQIAFLVRHGLIGGRLTGKEISEVRGWAETISREFGVSFSSELALRMARGAVRELAAFRQIYPKLLQRVKPKLIVEVVGYSYRCIPMTMIAHECGIPVAELQHGNIGATQLAYNFSDGRKPTTFPDYYLTFGDWWRQFAPHIPLSDQAMPAIGYAWLEQHRERLADVRPEDGRRVVLFISQGTIGAELSKWAVEACQRLGKDYRVRYKLHPGELLGWRKRYPWLLDAGVEIIEQPTNIYEEFARADVLVGANSTAVFEGLAFRKPLLLAKLPGYETVRALTDSGAATLCDGIDELIDAIGDAEAPSDSVRELIWQSHPVERFQEFVGRFL